MSKNLYELGGITFTSKEAIKRHAQSILAAHKKGQRLGIRDEQFVRDLLEWHPSASQKIGCGVDHIEIHVPPPWPSKGFLLVRVDGSTTDFSYRVCLNPGLADKEVSVRQAFRQAIAHQVHAVKWTAFASSDQVLCPVTGQYIGWDDACVDHYPTPFIDLFEGFLRLRSLSVSDISLTPSGDNQVADKLSDRQLDLDWQAWHLENARLRVIEKNTNSSLGAHGRTA